MITKTCTNVCAWSTASASKVAVAITPIPARFAIEGAFPRFRAPRPPARCEPDGSGNRAPVPRRSRLVEEASALQHPRPFFRGDLDIARRQEEHLVGDTL